MSSLNKRLKVENKQVSASSGQEGRLAENKTVKQELFQVTNLVNNETIFSKNSEPKVFSFFTNLQDVQYLVFNDTNSGYVLEPDHCVRVRLIAYCNKWLLQVGGYQCEPTQEARLNSCFDYNIPIRLVACPKQHQINGTNHDSLELVRKELAFNYDNFNSTWRNQLLLGEAVLLRVELDRKPLAKYKLILEYLDLLSNKQIRSLNFGKCHEESNLIKNVPISFSEKVSLFKFDENYSKLYHRMDLIAKTLRIGVGHRVLIYGPSNSGKSSLVHHLINQYLTRSSQPNPIVYYLECDPGQSEYAPCGILSLMTIKDQINSVPGFKFIYEPEQCLLSKSDGTKISKMLGTITPSDHRSQYESSINQLLEHFETIKSSDPLFINTMGWIEGLGFDLLQQIVDKAKPTHVIRLHNSETSPDIQLVVDRHTLNSTPHDVNELLRRKTLHPFKLWFASCCVAQKTRSFRLSPFRPSPIRREIIQLAYLTTGLWPDICKQPFSALQPIKLRLSSVFVHILNFPRISSYSTFDLLNASWVMLCYVNPNDAAKCLLVSDEKVTDTFGADHIVTTAEDNHTTTGVKLIHTIPERVTCLGCGVIRNIDSRQNCFYITMPHILANLQVDLQNLPNEGQQSNCARQNSMMQVNLIVLPDLIPTPVGLLAEQFLYHPSSTLPYAHYRIK